MAYNRYKSAVVATDKLGNRYYGTILYPTIPKSSSDIYIMARKGDRLDLLANSYYEDTTLWWVIAQANHLGKGTLSISEPQRIRIPTELESILKSFEDLQRSR
jgi:hypothetical protein